MMQNLIVSSCLSLLLLSGNGFDIGMNLGSTTDWNGAWTFVDLMKQSRQWITQDISDGDWDTGLRDAIDKDENGYPLQIPFPVDGHPDQRVVTVLAGEGDKLPAGIYDLLYEGEGDMRIWGSDVIRVRTVAAGHIEVEIGDHSSVFLTINQSSASNHLRNIRFIMPGFLDNYVEQLYHPLYLERLRGFRVLRFMDFMRTNGNQISQRAERTRPTSYTQNLPGGVSVEHMVALANRLDADAWFTLPLHAEDEYVREFAAEAYRGLEKQRKVYIEYSNELWNWAFSQTGEIAQMGCDDPLTFVPHTSGNDWGIAGCNDGASMYRKIVRRTFEIVRIFEEEFGSESGRIISVLASQAANSWHAEQMFRYAAEDFAVNPWGMTFEAYAIAPYFGGSVANYIHEQGHENYSVEDILDLAETHMEESAFEWMQKSKDLADQYGVQLIAYEGGQHLVGHGGVEKVDAITEKLIAANRHPRMQQLYDRYFRHWFDIGGGVFANFSFIGNPSKWGSWGVLEYQTQPIDQAPKYRALKNLID